MKKRCMLSLVCVAAIISLSACGTSKQTASSKSTSNDSIISNASTAESVSAVSTAAQDKNGFNDSTNVVDTMGGFSFSLPSYWQKDSKVYSDDAKRYYAETGSATAMLLLQKQSSTASDLTSGQDELVKGFGNSFENYKTSSINSITVAGKPAIQFSYTGSTSNVECNGYTIFILDSDNKELVNAGIIVSNNVANDYTPDFEKTVSSCTLTATPSSTAAQSTDAASEAASVENTGVTAAQENALAEAKSYLAYTSFSHDGLVKQLEYDNIAEADAVYAADNCGADWNEQAVKKAKEYMNYTSFSRDSLASQLEYEGFTSDQAAYGADACFNSSTQQGGESSGGSVSQQNALEKAKDYLSYTAFSYSGLVSQLEYDQFSHEDAVYAADNCGADWNEQAAAKAKSYLSYTSFSRDSLISQLEYDGFTSDQAAYGASANGF
jgi:hypothetical protein